MKNHLILLLFIACCWLACNSGLEKNDADDSTKSISYNTPLIKLAADNVSPATKEEILGPWTGGEYDNATFDIRKDSIYNVEHLESFKYTLTKDSIKIYYPDFLYSGKIYFIKDTLVMESEGEVSKYWKFKD